MPIVVLTTITTKPEGSLWFNQAEPAQMKELGRWIETYPGMLGGEGTALNSTTWKNTFIFESRKTGEQFLADLSEHPIHILRREFHKNNNNTFTAEITDA